MQAVTVVAVNNFFFTAVWRRLALFERRQLAKTENSTG